MDVEETLYHLGVSALYQEGRKEAANDPTPSQAVDDLWKLDKKSYKEAYTATLRKRLAALSTTVDAKFVLREVQDRTWTIYTGILHDEAEEFTRLPMTRTVPDLGDETPADALRRSGLSYLDRARTGLARQINVCRCLTNIDRFGAILDTFAGAAARR